MQDLSADNIESIESIVNSYGDILYRLCFIMLKKESDAEDIVQETIIKYIEKQPPFKDYEHIKAWLITVAKNKCRDRLRYKQRHTYIDIDEIRETPNYPTYNDNEILDVLMALPEKFRLVLMLYYVEEYQIDEIAKIIGKTASAVKMRLKKGRRLLKEQYGKERMPNDI